MTEPTPEPTPVTDTPAAQPEPVDTTDWKAEARKWETRAKENGAAAKELEKAQRASMTEAEKAIAEAETRGRTSALTEYGQRLARSEFVAVAAKRNPAWDATAVLEDLNLARYVGDDGEPDSKAIASAVARIVPELTESTGIPNLDLGQKPVAAKAPDMNARIRAAAGRS